MIIRPRTYLMKPRTCLKGFPRYGRSISQTYSSKSPQQPLYFGDTTATLVRISDEVKKDHRELENFYNRIVNTSDQDEQEKFQNMLVWELARHSVGEELVLYPAMEGCVEDGKKLAEKDRIQHHQVKEQLLKFQKIAPYDDQFIPTLQSLYTDLQEHIRDEEAMDLVRLEEALDRRESNRMAKSFQRTKHFVPTRSHPSAPSKPPFETVAGLILAPIDKVRDLFKTFPK